MSDVLDADILVEDGEPEPMTANELLSHLMQDLIAGEPPDALADEFIDEFVLTDREETSQILAMLETDSAALTGVLKGLAGQGYQEAITAIDQRGVAFLDQLKAAVKSRLVEKATANE